MFATLLAIAALYNFAPTPQNAAISALYADPKRPPVVRRVNVVGHYAAVLTSGGRIEGDLVNEPILVEHFSFGWQALDLLGLRCRLEARELGRNVDAALMAGMPRPKDDRPCHGYFRDSGPREDVENVRGLMRGPLVPYILVFGDWAIGEWYGAGGGESLYRKREDRWHLVLSDGGAMGVDDMRKYGVPQPAWCKLGIFDARCAKTRPKVVCQ
jgi:hypothetical protein